MVTKLKDGSCMAAGTVTRDAEMKHVGEKNRAVTSFSIAAGKRQDTTTIYVNVKAWGRLAEYAQGIRKGDAVCAVGRIEEREYNGKTYSDLVCDWLNCPTMTSGKAAPAPAPAAQTRADGFSDLEDDDGDLPF